MRHMFTCCCTYLALLQTNPTCPVFEASSSVAPWQKGKSYIQLGTHLPILLLHSVVSTPHGKAYSGLCAVHVPERSPLSHLFLRLMSCRFSFKGFRIEW